MELSARFYVEDLNILNMVRNRRLAPGISEQNWGTFVRLLTYKAEEAGGWVRKVPPHHTSDLRGWPPAAPDRGTGAGPGIVGQCKQ